MFKGDGAEQLMLWTGCFLLSAFARIMGNSSAANGYYVKESKEFADMSMKVIGEKSVEIEATMTKDKAAGPRRGGH